MNEDDRKQAKAVKKEKRKAFRRLAVRALPEIRTFQMFTKLTIMLLTSSLPRSSQDSLSRPRTVDSTIDVIITDNVSMAETLKNKIRDTDINECLIRRFETIRGSRELFCDITDRIYLYVMREAGLQISTPETTD